MSWRTVVVSSRCKLDYKLGHLVVRSDDDEKRIFLGDISVLLCESTAVAITTYLLSELVNHKIKVIFCDHKHNPQAELMPYYGSYDTSGKIRTQLTWDEETKAKVWQNIITAKITHQAHVLTQVRKKDKANQLKEYASQIQPGDPTNREGHAAKVYFNALFDDDFVRGHDDIVNSALNYGYTIILSAFNREVSTAGYLTQLGIWHDSSENPFNLGSDLMESFRPLVDLHVVHSQIKTFDSEQKHQLVNLLNSKIYINDSVQYVSNAISIYVHSVLRALEEKKPSLILNWYEL